MYVIEGYAHRYDSMAFDRSDRYLPGSLGSWAVSAPAFKLLLEHDPGVVLASRPRKNLEVFEDEHGLGFRAELPPSWTSIVGDVARGRLGCSVGEARVLRADGDVIRLAMVNEISLVECPAFADTSVWLCDADDLPYEVEQMRRVWRDGYAAQRRPAHTGIDVIDERNGYATTLAPKPRPSAPPAAARRQQLHGYVAHMLRGWNGQPMFIGHSGLTRRALGR